MSYYSPEPGEEDYYVGLIAVGLFALFVCVCYWSLIVPLF